jgi:hypothetical protein
MGPPSACRKRADIGQNATSGGPIPGLGDPNEINQFNRI